MVRGAGLSRGSGSTLTFCLERTKQGLPLNFPYLTKPLENPVVHLLIEYGCYFSHLSLSAKTEGY